MRRGVSCHKCSSGVVPSLGDLLASGDQAGPGQEEHGTPAAVAGCIWGAEMYHARPDPLRTRAFWSLANARKVLGYEPEDDSEVKFAKDIQGFLVGDGATGGPGRVGR